MFYNLHFQLNSLVWTLVSRYNWSLFYSCLIFYWENVEGPIFSDSKSLCAVLFIRKLELSQSRRLERRSSEKVSHTLARGWKTESDTWTTGASQRRLSGEVAVSGDWFRSEPRAPPGSGLEPRWEPLRRQMALKPAGVCRKPSSAGWGPCPFSSWCWRKRALCNCSSFRTSLAATSFPLPHPSFHSCSHSATTIWWPWRAMTSWARYVWRLSFPTQEPLEIKLRLANC